MTRRAVIAAAGDFRVQPQYGGVSTLVVTDASLVHQARHAVDAVGTPLLYARVDGIVRNETFLLMELELVEPNLLLDLDGGAPARFAEAIVDTITPPVSR